MAKMLELKFEEKALLDICNWMENTCENNVYVLGIDFEGGGVTLFGDPGHTQKFREELNKYLEYVFDNVNQWRNL